MSFRAYRWEFDYTRTPSGRLQPKLPVRFIFNRTTSVYGGLVDSGAEWTACHVDIAREAGIDVDSLPDRPIRGVGGPSRAKQTPIDLEILGQRIATEIYFVRSNIILLGRRDVFAAFQFGFDERAKLLLVEPY